MNNVLVSKLIMTLRYKLSLYSQTNGSTQVMSSLYVLSKEYLTELDDYMLVFKLLF